jgi:hypothetical protein
VRLKSRGVLDDWYTVCVHMPRAAERRLYE